MAFELEDQTWFVHLHNNVKQEWRVENREQKKELFQIQLDILLDTYRRNWETYQNLFEQTRKYEVNDIMASGVQKQVCNNSHEYRALQERIEKQLVKCQALNAQIDSIIKELSSKYNFVQETTNPRFYMLFFQRPFLYRVESIRIVSQAEGVPDFCVFERQSVFPEAEVTVPDDISKVLEYGRHS